LQQINNVDFHLLAYHLLLQTNHQRYQKHGVAGLQFIVHVLHLPQKYVRIKVGTNYLSKFLYQQKTLNDQFY